MTTLFTTTLSACALALVTLAATGAQAQQAAPAVQSQAAPIPASAFFANSSFGDAELSPDAKWLAVSFAVGNAGRTKLGVVDLVSNKLKVVAEYPNRDVSYFNWVNNERLVFSTGDAQIGQGDQAYGPGLIAINRDGTNAKTLVTASGELVTAQTIGRRPLRWNHFLVPQFGQQNSRYVYVTNANRTQGDAAYVNLFRLDTIEGTTEVVKRPGETSRWMLDAKGEPRLATTTEKNVATIWYLDPHTSIWRKLSSFDPYLGDKSTFTPLAFAPDGTLYVLSNAGGDKQALYTYDLATNKVSDAPLVALEDFDFRGSLVTNRDKLLGIRYTSDARATIWFDASMKRVQAAVDALLPDTINQISVPAHPDMPLVQVTAYSDRNPGDYYIYDIDKGKLNLIGQKRPDISPVQMARQDFYKIKARDGLSIPVYLTKPAGKNLPMVVMVHGGPYVRGHQWGWSASAQFLASRGYVVLEPEFRGSTGYGSRHYRAGWKQWGLAMQNDIADATRWAIAQGIADGKRICIAGASYGGYATLMGLVNDPDLYQCGINWVGVTDINLLHSGHWSFRSDIGDGYKKYGMPTLVGDVVKDVEQFKATSPLVQAARIKQPLLMAYGAADMRVPLYHGQQFYAAVKQTNPNVEMIVYQDEGHGWALPKTRLDFWTRVEKFLDKHIGKP